MYLVKTPNIIQHAYRSYSWRINSKEKSIYLSFDDGPNQDSTALILSILKEYNAKCCFFCLGSQIEKHPELFNQIIQDGHSIGNHGYNHISGWNNSTEDYCQNAFSGAEKSNSSMFRPPFGRIRPAQARILAKSFNLVMWDVMSGDFDLSISAEACFENIKRKSKPGSIVVLHDNIKSFQKMELLLPMILDYFSELDYAFKAITPELLSI